MWLWCGLDRTVVAKPTADAVLSKHRRQVQTLSQWKAIHQAAAAAGDAKSRGADRSLWQRVAACGGGLYTPEAARQSRQEAASLLAAALPQGWCAVIGGYDLVGVPSPVDPVVVSLFTAGAAELRSQVFTATASALEQLFPLQSGVRSATTEQGEPVLVLQENAASDTGGECWVEVAHSVGLPALKQAVKQLRGVQVACRCEMDQGKSYVVFENSAAAAVAMNMGFGENWGRRYRFASCPRALCAQSCTMTCAESSSVVGSGIPFRTALLLRHYLCPPVTLSFVHIVLSWVQHHNLCYLPRNAVLIMLAHYLLAQGHAEYVDPSTLQPLSVLPPSAPANAAQSAERVELLLKGFFDFYTAFDFKARAIAIHARDVHSVIRERTPVPNPTLAQGEDEHMHGEVVVMDPFTGDNTTRSVPAVLLLHFKGLCGASSVLLRREDDVEGVLGLLPAGARAGYAYGEGIDTLFTKICGPGAAAADVREECFIPVSNAAQDTASAARPGPIVIPRAASKPASPISMPAAPPSPSYTGTVTVLKPNSDGRSINEIVGAAGLWDDSPSASPVSASAGSYPGSFVFSGFPPRREQNDSITSLDLSVDALVAEMLNNEQEESCSEASPNHLSLFNRGRVGPKVDTSVKAALAPLVLRAPVSPCGMLGGVFPGGKGACASPSSPMRDDELREMLSNLDDSKEGSSLE